MVGVPRYPSLQQRYNNSILSTDSQDGQPADAARTPQHTPDDASSSWKLREEVRAGIERRRGAGRRRWVAGTLPSTPSLTVPVLAARATGRGAALRHGVEGSYIRRVSGELGEQLRRGQRGLIGGTPTLQVFEDVADGGVPLAGKNAGQERGQGRSRGRGRHVHSGGSDGRAGPRPMQHQSGSRGEARASRCCHRCRVAEPQSCRAAELQPPRIPRAAEARWALVGRRRRKAGAADAARPPRSAVYP